MDMGAVLAMDMGVTDLAVIPLLNISETWKSIIVPWPIPTTTELMQLPDVIPFEAFRILKRVIKFE